MKPSLMLAAGICLAIIGHACDSPSPPKQAEASPQPQASPADLSGWQQASLADKGIRFRVPANWRHDESDLESKHEQYTAEAIEWNTPGESVANTKMVRIYLTTYHKGFVSLGGAASSQAKMLQEKLASLTEGGSDSPYTDVKELERTGVGGAFRLLRVDPKLGRMGVLWTAYRIYKGQAQEVDINISGAPGDESLLRRIFDTLEVDHD